MQQRAWMKRNSPPAHPSPILTSHKHPDSFQISTLPYLFKACFELHHVQSVDEHALIQQLHSWCALVKQSEVQKGV